MSGTCSVCGGHIQSGNHYGICQRSPECRHEYHKLADKPRLSESELQVILLANIFEHVVHLPRDAAREIAHSFRGVQRYEALMRFAGLRDWNAA